MSRVWHLCILNSTTRREKKKELGLSGSDKLDHKKTERIHDKACCVVAIT